MTIVTTEQENVMHVETPPLMHAVVTEAYGGPEVMQMQTVPTPTPGDGEVLVAVEAAGVDRGVWHLMAGLPMLVRLGFGLRRPKTPVPGFDLAGTVVSRGPGATRFAVGDEVYGIGTGTFADYAVAPEDKLVSKPAAMSWEEAGAATISGITAFEALRDVAALAPGQRVLVIGASGGVGSFAVQIARDLGAEVVGVASAHKAEFVQSLGATVCLDHQAGNIADVAAPHAPFDVVLELGGLNPVSELRSLLTRNGTLVLIGGEGGNTLTGGFEKAIVSGLKSTFLSHNIPFFLSAEKPEIIAAFGQLLAEGNVRTSVEHSYALEGAAQALADLEDGKVRGKAVLRTSRNNGQTPGHHRESDR